jgi:sRNA-binding regulator protein Hfq
VLDDGEQLRGHIEWYDRNCLKVHRPDSPNLLVFKQHIKYLYKQEDE